MSSPCPCGDCPDHPGSCGPGIGETQAHSTRHACGPYAAYVAKRELVGEMVGRAKRAVELIGIAIGPGHYMDGAIAMATDLETMLREKGLIEA